MRLSLRTEYALRVLAQLGKIYGQDKLAQIDFLSRTESVPSNYLVQILNELRNSGLVGSRRGKQGGYFLSQSPDLVTVYDIIRATDSDILDNSMKPDGEHGRHISVVWNGLVQQIHGKLKSVTLRDVMKPEDDKMYYI